MVGIWFAIGLTLWMGLGQYIILKRFIDPKARFSISMFSALAMILWPLYYLFNKIKREADK